MTFGDIIDRWLTYRRRLTDLGIVQESTHKNQADKAEIIKRGLGHHAVEALRKSHVEFWLGERRKTCAPITLQFEVNLIRQIFNWGIDESLIASKPRLPSVSVPNTEEELPSDAAFLFAMRHLPRQHSEASEFMLLTGLAPHELERLQPRDGALSGDPRIEIGFRDDFFVKTAARRRRVPMNARAAAIWTARTFGMVPNQRVFPTVEAMQKALERLRNEPPAGVAVPEGFDRITPKMMRKWFSSVIASTDPEQALQRLLGHVPGSKVTRRHYVRSTPVQLRDAVQRLALAR